MKFISASFSLAWSFLRLNLGLNFFICQVEASLFGVVWIESTVLSTKDMLLHLWSECGFCNWCVPIFIALVKPWSYVNPVLLIVSGATISWSEHILGLDIWNIPLVTWYSWALVRFLISSHCLNLRHLFFFFDVCRLVACITWHFLHGVSFISNFN